MSNGKLGILIAVGIILIALVGILNPSVAIAVIGHIDALMFIVILVFMPSMLGIVFDLIVDKIDSRVDIHITVSRNQHWLIAIVFGTLVGLMQVMLVDILASIPYIYNITGSIKAEGLLQPNVIWCLWGLVTFVGMYMAQHKLHQEQSKS